MSFYTKPRGSASSYIKDLFRKANGLVFKSQAKFPEKDRAQITEEQLNAFDPSGVRERRIRSEIKSVNVYTRTLPDSALKKVTNVVTSSGSSVRLNKRHIFVEMEVHKIFLRKNKARFFVRVEQGGKVQFGRFLIQEKVFSRKPTITSDSSTNEKNNTHKFSFWLTGPLSPLSTNFYDQAIDFGGQFTVLISTSGDGKVWSNDRTLRFYFENGKLSPP